MTDRRGDGANIVVGGFGNDTITTGVDTDIVLATRSVTYTADTTCCAAVSTDVVTGPRQRHDHRQRG